jgi:hypothetical protein
MHTKTGLRDVLLMSLAVSVLFLSGCSAAAYERTDKPSRDWSRGLLLGEGNIRQSVALAIDPQRRVHLAWIEPLPDQSEGIHYVQINQLGQVEVDRTLSIDLPFPRQPRFLVDQGDELGLVLLSRSDGIQGLYLVPFDATGQTGAPVRLSELGEEVASFQVYLPPTGDTIFIWDGRSAAGTTGIHRVLLQDDAIASRSLLVPEGIDPDVLVDADGTAHLAWLVRTGYTVRDLKYAALVGTQLDPPSGVHLTTFEYAESATYHGPAIGTDRERIYVLWSVQNMGGGLTPTAAFSHFVSFQKGNPRTLGARTLALPSNPRPDYGAHDSPYGYSELAPPAILGTDFVNAPDTVQGQETELPFSVSLMLESASKSFMQLAMVVLSDGEPVGYQLVNSTPNASVLSTLVADGDGDLHLAWLDVAGFARYKVYYATTAPEAREWLDRITAADIAQRAAGLAFGVLSGLAIAFLSLTWNVLPVLTIILFYFIGREERLDRLAPKIGLVLAVVLYLATKAYFIPGLLTAGTPFLYAVPPRARTLLMAAVPALVLLLALTSIYVYVRRSEEPTLFKAYLFFALTDGLLTAALYGPRFFSTR